MFDPKSRYAKAKPAQLTDARGRTVEVIPPAPAPDQGWMGTHLRRQGERPDHLAARYLSDPSGYWRIAEINDAMTAEVLTERAEISIPSTTPGGR
jgi:hypothetical protein